MSQPLAHKGYIGFVEYSAEDHLLHGTIQGIRDAVTYEGDDVRSLEANFAAAVDEYLELSGNRAKNTLSIHAS